ncbi:YtxH domain-containing protein [Micrococcus sp.]|uniref:YtxH domain-containing protein n=1 Tax=Micrococcus sp. TaxID=1271 RepID=UPI002A91F8E0|nr:YtxH domain-containing protein [Micrococcus sp.]MDY6055863.1 YtxH domain-containing protein [Micrococcus sp.]
MRWITLGVGAALGYLLGSAEGRQNLEKMTQNAQKFWNDPQTQKKVSQVQEQAKSTLADVKDSEQVKKAGEAAAAAKEKVQEKVEQVTSAGEDNAETDHSQGADPDVVSDPSTPMADEGPANS